MSLLAEYINRKMDIAALENELLRLISEYNRIRSRFLFIFSASLSKQIPGFSIEQADYYVFFDMLSGLTDVRNLDIYIETPGGSGETVEEIVWFLRNKFDTVDFVVAGEAKSAGTIMVLSGDNILMTQTGSLGPIDAQVKIGRSVMSAYDYMEWVQLKRKEASEKGMLNPFDATMVAQITPGEIGGVHHSLEFAKDLVKKWLVQYKFKDWNETRTNRRPVTAEMKETRANEISTELVNHSKWRSHGRSMKVDDLEAIGIVIEKIDNKPELADIVYRIKTVCSLIFSSSSTFKIFATHNEKIFRTAMTAPPLPASNKVQIPDVAKIDIKCEKCGKDYHYYAKLKPVANIDDKLKDSGLVPFPSDSLLKCDNCGHETDLSGIKNQIELETGQKFYLKESDV